MKRQYYFDWLRVLAFVILIFTHVSYIFTHDNTYIVNDEKSKLIEMAFSFFALWRIPLLFFISGAVISFSLHKKTPMEYIKSRFTRLLVPLLFTFFIVIPPIFYIKARFDNDATFSFSNYFYEMIDSGYLKWQHMWYVAYILLYSVVAYPLFSYLSKLKREKKGDIRLLSKRFSIFLLLLPVFLVECYLSPYFPFTHQLWNDYYYIGFSLIIFVYGYGFALSGNLKNRVVKDRYLLLAIAVISLGIAFFLNSKNPVAYSPEYYLFKLFKTSNVLLTIFAILGFAVRHLNYGHKNLAYANEAVYPFYILHNTILVFVAYFIVQWDISLYLKFFIISLSVFVIAFILYEFVIRKFYPLRYVFGGNIKKQKSGDRSREMIPDHLQRRKKTA